MPAAGKNSRKYRVRRRAKGGAIVTGGAGGIGKAIVKRLLDAGVSVMIADKQVKTSRLATYPRKASRSKLLSYQIDISDPFQVDRMVKAAAAEFGEIRILINSAGGAVAAPFVKTSPDLLNKMLAINLCGPFYCAQACARLMMKSGGGRIIHIASHSGLLGSTDRAAYAASKGGLIAATRVMAVELAPFGITVNAIAPGPVEVTRHKIGHSDARRMVWTEAVPVGRYADPDEIAAAAVFLAIDKSDYITGEVISIDGGFGAAGIMMKKKH